MGDRNRPVSVIFDTDVWSDIDDPLALAMVHALEDRGEMKLLAVTISTNYPWCAPYIDVLNTFYGRPHVPIGMVREGMDVEFIIRQLPDWFVPVSRYVHLCERKNADGTWLHPHRLTPESAIPDAAQLLRETLAAQEDGSVVVIQIGYSTNLARLLSSPGDAISSLSGRELVRKKVRSLVVMAGSFRKSTTSEGAPCARASRGKTLPKQDPEFNLMVDVPAAQALFANWPTPIVASGVEVGEALPFPPESVLHDFRYVQNHPIEQTYRLFGDERQAKYPDTANPHPHLTFDLTTVLYAARPDRNYFSLSEPGWISVMDDGSSRFEADPKGSHQYLVLSEEQKARTLEAMVMLTTQPPRAVCAK
jgi:inosine-uridine nucleoside N-ribohydrolase